MVGSEADTQQQTREKSDYCCYKFSTNSVFPCFTNSMLHILILQESLSIPFAGVVLCMFMGVATKGATFVTGTRRGHLVVVNETASTRASRIGLARHSDCIVTEKVTRACPRVAHLWKFTHVLGKNHLELVLDDFGSGQRVENKAN